MIKREMLMPAELIQEIAEIVHKECPLLVPGGSQRSLAVMCHCGICVATLWSLYDSFVYLAFDLGTCLHKLIEGCRVAQQYGITQHGSVVLGKGFARIFFGNEP